MVIHSTTQVAGSAPDTANRSHDSASIQIGRDENNIPAINDHGYQICEEPLGIKRKIKVIILGAGASGIDFFKNAEEKLENVEIQCYEKNHDIGGTVSTGYFTNTWKTVTSRFEG